MRIIDTHCHLNFKAFRDTYHQKIEKALASDMGLIIVGAGRDTSERAVAIAHAYEHDPVYAAVGQHPTHVADEPFNGEWLKALAQDSKVVAIGETGIDLYRPEEIASHELQKQFLQDHADVANQLGKPLIIHSRGTADTLQTAIEDILQLIFPRREVNDVPSLRQKRPSRVSPSSAEEGGGGVIAEADNSPQPSLVRKRGSAVFHCFTGTDDQVKQILDAGCMVSFTGVITFAKELEDTVKALPMDRLMIETDSPYLAPARYRGKQNEPIYVEEVARKVAEIHGREYDEVLAQTTQNAIDFFGL